jgi:hypothetical protein
MDTSCRHRTLRRGRALSPRSIKRTHRRSLSVRVVSAAHHMAHDADCASRRVISIPSSPRALVACARLPAVSHARLAPLLGHRRFLAALYSVWNPSTLQQLLATLTFLHLHHHRPHAPDEDTEDLQRPPLLPDSLQTLLFSTMTAAARLGLAAELVLPSVKLASLAIISQSISSVSDETPSAALFSHMKKWITSILQPLLSNLVPGELHKDVLSYALTVAADACLRVRTKSFFEMVVDVPDSLDAFADMADALELLPSRKTQVVLQARLTLERRLLHAGAGTSDIISQYVNTVRAVSKLRLAPEDVHSVVEPVCAYLRTRDDTVRAVVSAVVDGQSGDCCRLHGGRSCACWLTHCPPQTSS